MLVGQIYHLPYYVPLYWKCLQKPGKEDWAYGAFCSGKKTFAHWELERPGNMAFGRWKLSRPWRNAYIRARSLTVEHHPFLASSGSDRALTRLYITVYLDQHYFPIPAKMGEGLQTTTTTVTTHTAECSSRCRTRTCCRSPSGRWGSSCTSLPMPRTSAWGTCPSCICPPATLTRKKIASWPLTFSYGLETLSCVLETFSHGLETLSYGLETFSYALHWKLSVMDWKLSVMDWKLSVMHWKLSVMHWKLSVMDWKLSVMHWKLCNNVRRATDRLGIYFC